MLLDAVTRGRIYQVKFLLESGTEDINKTDENRQTALMKAIFLDDKMHRTRYKVVKLLLEHGARVNMVDREGKSALMWACIRGQDKIVRKIIEASILDLDLNGGDRSDSTALFYAASGGHVNIVKMLITAMKRFGLDMDKKNAQGMTPILEATKQGHDSCAQVLMTEGKASLTIRDPQTFLNTREWAEKRSLTNLSELIANRRSPSPQIAVQNVENENELDDVQTPRTTTESPIKNDQTNSQSVASQDNANESLLAEQQRNDLTVKRIKGAGESRSLSPSPLLQDSVTPAENRKNESISPKSTISVSLTRRKSATESISPSPQLKDSGTPAENKNESTSPRSTITVSLTKRKREYMEKIKGPPLTAKSEMCRLLGLYGIQHSESYRQSFDPILLPPSGYWPDPLAHLRDNASSVGDDQDLEMNFLDLIRPRGNRRRSSAFPGAADARRGSNVNFLREGRRGSTMPGGGLSPFGAGAARRGSTVPSAMSGNRNFLEAPAIVPRRTLGLNSGNGDRRGSAVAGSDRRGSLMIRGGGSEMSRPNLPRRTTHLGYIQETD